MYFLAFTSTRLKVVKHLAQGHSCEKLSRFKVVHLWGLTMSHVH